MPWRPIKAQEDDKKWHPHLEIEGKSSKVRDIGEIAAFIPILQDEDALLFSDIRARHDNLDSDEFNLGIGYRKQLNNRIILGGYGFYDRRRTPNDNSFNQLTLGFETITSHWEARVNGYLPESTEKNIGQESFVGIVSGGNLQIQKLSAPKERALPGFDIEIGRGFDLAQDLELWAYAGGYYFNANGYDKVSGPRTRLEITYKADQYFIDGTRFTLGVETQNDDQRGEQTFGLIRVRVPFYNIHSDQSHTLIDQRMTTRIVRDVDIVSAGKKPEVLSMESATTTTAGGNQVSSITTIQAGDNIATTVTAAGNDALIAIDGSNGTIITNAKANLLPGQSIVGGQSEIQITGTSGNIAILRIPGQRPIITGTDMAQDIFGMANNTSIKGIDMTGGRLGIQLNGVVNTLVQDVSISSTDGTGITVISGSTGTFRDIDITNTGSNGMFISTGSNITASNIDIDGTSVFGINVVGATLNIENSNITNTTNDGFTSSASSTVTMNTTNISNAGGDAVSLLNSNLSGSGNVISGFVSALTCNNSGGNTGSLSFTDVQSTGPASCP